MLDCVRSQHQGRGRLTVTTVLCEAGCLAQVPEAAADVVGEVRKAGAAQAVLDEDRWPMEVTGHRHPPGQRAGLSGGAAAASGSPRLPASSSAASTAASSMHLANASAWAGET